MDQEAPHARCAHFGERDLFLGGERRHAPLKRGLGGQAIAVAPVAEDFTDAEHEIPILALYPDNVLNALAGRREFKVSRFLLYPKSLGTKALDLQGQDQDSRPVRAALKEVHAARSEKDRTLAGRLRIPRSQIAIALGHADPSAPVVTGVYDHAVRTPEAREVLEKVATEIRRIVSSLVEATTPDALMMPLVTRSGVDAEVMANLLCGLWSADIF